MEKNIFKTLFLTSLLLIIPLFSNVRAETINTVVTGSVTHIGVGISGADIHIACNGNVRNTTTNSSGDYIVTYPTAECEVGDMAFVTATAPIGFGSNQAAVQHFNFGPGLDLDIAIIDIALPEFGLITGALTAVGSGITFFGLKRKFKNN